MVIANSIVASPYPVRISSHRRQYLPVCVSLAILLSPVLVDSLVSAASFSPAASFLPDFTTGSAAWGDYDNDGGLDLVVIGFQQGVGFINDIWRNDGGTFTRINAGPFDWSAASPVWGDYDRDGDLDLALTTYDPSVPAQRAEIWRNEGGVFVKQAQTLLSQLGGTIIWG